MEESKNLLGGLKNMISGGEKEVKEEISGETKKLKQDFVDFYIEKVKEEKNLLTGLAIGESMKKYLSSDGTNDDPVEGFGSKILLKIVDKDTSDELDKFKAALDATSDEVLGKANKDMTKQELESLLGIVQPTSESQESDPSTTTNTLPPIIPLPITTGGTESKVDLYDGKYAFPVGGEKKSLKLSSLFGNRVHPVTKKPNDHTGIDIGAPLGTPLLAMVSGEIIKNKQTKLGGWEVWLKGDDGKTYAYLHMKEQSKIPEKTKVVAGQEIGIVGSTGSSTGPHLHLTIKDENKKNIDPMVDFAGVFTGEHMNISDDFSKIIAQRQSSGEKEYFNQAA